MENSNCDKKCYRIDVDKSNGRYLDVVVPDRPLRFLDVVPVMHSITDALVDNTISMAETKVTCGPKCGVCCKQLVPLSMPEVFYIENKLLALPLNQRGAFLHQFDENEKNLNKHGFIDILKSVEQIKNDAEVAKEYFKLNIFCPFLVNQSCAIHSWRPVVCREFNSLSDPSLCGDPFGNTVKSLQYLKRPSSILAKLCSKLTELPAVFAPFPLLFEYLELFQDISSQEWEADFLIKNLLELVFDKNI